MKYFALTLLVCLSFAIIPSAQADLAPDERIFLKDFLGLTHREANFRFEEKTIEASATSTVRYGEFKPSTPFCLYLNFDLFKAQNDSGLRLRGTRVHEAIHAFLAQKKVSNSAWVEEGFAVLGEYLFDLKTFGREETLLSFLPLVKAYQAYEGRPLESFDGSPEDYGKVLLFSLFLYETFQQNNFTRAWYAAPQPDWAGIVSAAKNSSSAPLTPDDWKTNAFINENFRRSLRVNQHRLSTQSHDTFTEILNTLIAEEAP